MDNDNNIFTDEEIDIFHKYIELIDPDSIVLDKTKNQIEKTKEFVLINKNNNKEDDNGNK